MTTTTQHTPGPFEWQDGRMIATTKGEAVLEAGIDDDDGITPFIAVTDEDAHLIAAAPDGLELAHWLRDEYCEGGMFDGTEAEARILAFIAKAEGRAS